MGAIASLLEDASRFRRNYLINLEKYLLVDNPITVDNRIFVAGSNEGNIFQAIAQQFDGSTQMDSKAGPKQQQSIQIGGANSGTINQVAAERISNSFNATAVAAALSKEDELAGMLEAFRAEAQNVLPKLDLENQSNLAQGVETLVAEATKESPRKKWYELSKEGITEAVSTLGEVAQPLIDIATKIVNFLASGSPQ